MESKPSVIVLCTYTKEGSGIAKGILGVECLPESSCAVEGVECWQWQVENKYYTASVQVAVVSQPGQCKSWVRGCGEALLVYCDSSQNDALEQVNSTVESVGDFEPEVKMLVCDSCASDDSAIGLTRLTAQQWCISNGWELVELNPQAAESGESEDEDDFPESWGYKRIRQALHAHTWSNLDLKDSGGGHLSAVLQSVASRSDTAPECDEVMYSRLSDLTMGERQDQEGEAGSTVDPSLLEEALLNPEDDFENLFSNFEHLKRTAATLPPNQRRDYAEKVAVAFWRAMGGDEDEVTGLDSD